MDQKIENLLLLALDTPSGTRDESQNLSVGYEESTDLWEIIIRYAGAFDELNIVYEQASILLGGYAVLRVTQAELEALSFHPLVQFVEKPKVLTFERYEGKQISCIPAVQREPFNLSGVSVLCGIIDSGIDIFHSEFRKEDGTTRIVGLWDQTWAEGVPPEGYYLGSYFSKEELDARIAAGEESVPGGDVSGHGTHVAGIAAGNGGVAYGADLLIVKLKGPQTANLMMAVDFCVRQGIAREMPLALNLSFGNSYGSHDGTSLIETYIDSVSDLGKNTICVGSGNEGNRNRHVRLQVSEEEAFRCEFVVAPAERELSIQIWKQYQDDIEIELQSPGGSTVVYTENSQGSYRNVLDGTEVLWYFGEPAPYRQAQEVYLILLPGRYEEIGQGIWQLTFTGVNIRYGAVELWLPSGNEISDTTGFLVPTVSNTLTVPSTAGKIITVGAYNAYTDTYASFSGRGQYDNLLVKPDLVAPGVDIVSASPGGGFVSRTGTSMACPFVTGAAALLMQYGIVDRRDVFLYGEKVKAYLIRGARQLPGEKVPSERTGWGALCVKDSLPE